MFRLIHPLYFPRLIRSGETTFKAHSDVSRSTSIYKLDWDEVDRIKKDNWEKRTLISSDQPLPPFPGTLPDEYAWVKDLRYALPRNYLDQIRHCARQAMEIWGKEYGFDTMIREICLEPAIAHSYVAFRLVSDCIYDESTNYWSRDDSRIIVPQALLYKFWIHQTGRGMVRDHAYFEKITWRLKESDYTSYAGMQNNDSKTDEIRKFIIAIDEFERRAEKSFPQLGDNVEVTGPSLGEKDMPSWEPDQASSTSSGNTFLSITKDSSVYLTPDSEKVFTITASDGTELFSVSDPTRKERPHVKTPARTTHAGITVCTTCKDRNEDLLRCLPSWLKYGFQNLVIVDWSSEQSVSETITEYELLYGKVDDVDIKVIRIDTDEPFVSSIAKNIALRACETNKVLLIDADVKLKGFDYSLEEGQDKPCFYAGVETGKGTTGTCFVNISDVDKIGGFNEYMKYWGGEEIDFRNRLEKDAKIERLPFRPSDLEHLDHSDHIRLKNRGQDGVTKIEGQRYNIGKTDPWGPSCEQKKFFVTIYRNGKMEEKNVEM